MPKEKSLPSKFAALWRRLINYFLTGIILCAPVGITIYLIRSFIVFSDEVVKPYIPDLYNPESYVPFSIPGLGIIFSIVALTILGWLAAWTFGRQFVNLGEAILSRLPVIRTIYNTLKQIFESILSQDSPSYQKVGLIEYPRPGIWALGFIAATTTGKIAERVNQLCQDRVITMFIPTAPNPTSGFILFVPEKDILYLDIKVDLAARFILSGGLVREEPLVANDLQEKEAKADQPACI